MLHSNHYLLRYIPGTTCTKYQWTYFVPSNRCLRSLGAVWLLSDDLPCFPTVSAHPGGECGLAAVGHGTGRTASRMLPCVMPMLKYLLDKNSKSNFRTSTAHHLKSNYEWVDQGHRFQPSLLCVSAAAQFLSSWDTGSEANSQPYHYLIMRRGLPQTQEYSNLRFAVYCVLEVGEWGLEPVPIPGYRYLCHALW